MIVNLETKAYQTRSDMPNQNWLGEGWAVVPDGSDIANDIIKFYPRYEFIMEDEEIIGIKEIPKTQEEIDNERVEEIKSELTDLDTTINRATEDLYTLTKTTPYASTQQVINRKIELREELKTLTGGDASAKNNAN